MTTTLPLVAGFVLLLGLGFFFGLAFEEFHAQGGQARPGGVRSFPLLALAGALLYRLDTQRLLPLSIGLLVLGGWLACYYWRHVAETDPEGRPTVMDLLHGLKERVFPVGRLDYHSEGLLLLTNDGDFTNGLTSASHHIPKTYLVKVNGSLSTEQEEQFRSGIPVEGRMTAPAGLKLIRRAENPWYEVRLIEGRKNQIRVMFKHCGRLVEKLKRVRVGFLELGPLKPGEFRHLSIEEVERFQKLIRKSAKSHE